MKFIPLLALFILNSAAEVVNTQSTSNVSRSTYNEKDFFYNSPVCTKAKQLSTQSTTEIQTQIVEVIKENKIAKAINFSIQQVALLESIGGHTIMANPHLKRAWQPANQSCKSKQLNNFLNVRSEKAPVNSDLQKRYLAAQVEAKRIGLVLADNLYLTLPNADAEKKKLIKRLEKIQKYYPLAGTPYPSQKQLQVEFDIYQDITRSRLSHEDIDDYLFPDPNTNKFKSIQSSKNAGGAAEFINKLIEKDKLPEHITKSMISSMATNLKTVGQALEKFCSLDPCETIKLDLSTMTEITNQLSQEQSQEMLKATCDCEIGKKSIDKILMDAFTAGGAAGSAVGAIGCVGSLFFTAIGGAAICPVALGTGTATSVWATANTLQSIEELSTENNYKDILSALPGTQTQDLQRINQRISKLKTEVGLDLLIAAGGTIGGGYAARGIAVYAGPAMKSLKSVLGRQPQVPRGLQYISNVSDRAITRSTKEGKVTYQIVNKNGQVEDLRMDVTGQAINAQDPKVREFAKQHMAAGDKTVVFVDVNNLGKVNYFADGTRVGDDYLASVAEAVQKNIGDNGVVYRWGGDEFVVVMNSTDGPQIQRTLTNTVNDVFDSPKARQLFRDEKLIRSANFRAVQRADRFEDLPSDFVSTLQPQELEFAKTDFSAFKNIHFKVEANGLYELASLRPTVSIGSAVVNGRAPERVLEIAEAQAATTKVNYKRKLGQDTQKYEGRKPYLPERHQGRTPRQLNARPEVLWPDGAQP